MLTKPTGTPTPSPAICLLICQKQQAIKAQKNKTVWELSENTVWMLKTMFKNNNLFLTPPPQPVSEEHLGERVQMKFSVKKQCMSTSFVWRSVVSRRSGNLERHHKDKAWPLPPWQYPQAPLCSLASMACCQKTEFCPLHCVRCKTKGIFGQIWITIQKYKNIRDTRTR